MTGVGLAQPNPNAPPSRPTDERHGQQDPAERVEVGDRVERQPPEQLGRAVAEPIGRQRVAELVDREADEQHDRDDDDATRADLVGSKRLLGYGSRVS